MTRTTIDNTESVLDSRDIIERLQELGDAFDAWREEHPTPSPNEWEGMDEMNALSKLAKEAESADGWRHGVTLIRDDYFTEYARQLLEDCGTIPRNLPDWVVIDWDATARNVQVDYFPVDFDGVTYWVR